MKSLRRALVTITALLASVSAAAQSSPGPGQSAYVELGGSAGAISVNYERQLSAPSSNLNGAVFSLRVGLGLLPGGRSMTVGIPVGLGGVFPFKPSYNPGGHVDAEMGIGLTFLPGAEQEVGFGTPGKLQYLPWLSLGMRIGREQWFRITGMVFLDEDRRDYRDGEIETQWWGGLGFGKNF